MHDMHDQMLSQMSAHVMSRGNCYVLKWILSQNGFSTQMKIRVILLAD